MTTTKQVRTIKVGTATVLDSMYQLIATNPTPEGRKKVADSLCLLISKTLPHLKAVIDQKEKQYVRILIVTKDNRVIWEVQLFVDNSPTYQILWPQGMLDPESWEVAIGYDWEVERDLHYLTAVDNATALLVCINSEIQAVR